MHLHAAAHAGTGASGAGSRAISTWTCRTRRVGAGATGAVRGCAGVPRAAAAAAAAPSSAARATGFGVLAYSCTGAGALSSRCARAALALRSRCATHTPAIEIKVIGNQVLALLELAAVLDPLNRVHEMRFLENGLCKHRFLNSRCAREDDRVALRLVFDVRNEPFVDARCIERADTKLGLHDATAE